MYKYAILWFILSNYIFKGMEIFLISFANQRSEKKKHAPHFSLEKNTGLLSMTANVSLDWIY